MKKILAFSAILLAYATSMPTASAATEAEKLAAIQTGLAHLATLQAANGSWTISGGNPEAGAGAAVFAFLAQQAKWPAAQAAAYQAIVDKGIAYLLSVAVTETVSVNNASPAVNICPGGSGTCTGIYWSSGYSETYSTGLVVPAIDSYGLLKGANAIADNNPVGAGHPLGGMTWLQIAQAVTNAFAASQAATVGGSYAAYRGGWHYQIPANVDADTSTTQWGVIAIGYDESLGAVTPSSIKANLANYYGGVQQSPGGGVCYEPISVGCSIGPTFSDTGGWELGMTYLGGNLNAAQQNGLAFLNTNWTQDGSSWYGLFGHPYAMWAVYKGLDATITRADTTHITTRKTDCGAAANKLPGSGVCNWWEDFNEYLVRHQTVATGAWPDLGGNWPDPLSTSLFVNILGATPLPGSLAQPNPVSVPALSEFGLVALGVLLAGAAALKFRKSHA